MVSDRGITILYEPSPPQKPEVDIIFVHGFTGHPKATWTLAAEKIKKHRPDLKHDVYWPRDELPKAIPTARILTFGYDTQIRHVLQGQISKNTLQDHARELLAQLKDNRGSDEARLRPLVFVSHSLGGLVVREALTVVSLRQEVWARSGRYEELVQSTIAILFFGTPHRGADPRNAAHRLLTYTARKIGYRDPAHIVNALLPKLDDYRRHVSLTDFLTLISAKGWKVYTFQEEYGIASLGGKQVVEDGSSALGVESEICRRISNNHMDMCRFHCGSDDREYQKVVKAFLDDILPKIRRQSHDQTRRVVPSPRGTLGHPPSSGPSASYAYTPPTAQSLQPTGNNSGRDIGHPDSSTPAWDGSTRDEGSMELPLRGARGQFQNSAECASNVRHGPYSSPPPGLSVSSYLQYQRNNSTDQRTGCPPTIPSPSEQHSGSSAQQHVQLNIMEALPNGTYLTLGNNPSHDQSLLSAGQNLSSAGQERMIESMSTTLRSPPTRRVTFGTLPSASDTEGRMDIYPEDEPKIDLATKKKMVDLLKFDELGARMVDIKQAQMQTCQWFLTKPEYTKWKNGNEGLCDSGFLWIKGKPGTGKSTLMKYLHSIRSLQPNCTVISFFFNARGAELEKSTLGCYRTLLFLLLDGRQEVWEAMDHLGKAGSSHIVSNGWNIGSLTETFKNAVEFVAKKQPVECWIDALDECKDSDVEQMVSFFEDLDEFTLSNRLAFRVCFASRHYPAIVPRKAIQLVLEKEQQHELDISKYIATRLRMGNSVYKSEIQSKLLAMSSSIFLWVVLVIPILNREYARGNISALRKRLDEIPPGLDALFHSILTRDEEDMQELLRCLQWILCAIRPLKPLELYTAIQPSANSYSSGHFKAVDPRSSARVTAREDEMSIEDLHHYVDSVSKGLAEVTSSSTAPVQFIHESVGDFLLGKSGRSDLLSRITGFNFGNPGDIHETLKQVCLEHILAAYSTIFSDDPSGSLDPSADHTLKLDIRNNSFLHYAVTNVLRHADQAYRGGISQTAFLQEFPTHKWTRLYNALGNVENEFEFKIFQTAPSILYLLAQFDAHHLLRDHPELCKQFSVSCGGWRYPWVVAAWEGNIESLRHLVNAAVASSSSHVTSQQVSSTIDGMNRVRFFSRQKTPDEEVDAVVAAHLAAFGHGPLLESFFVQVGSRHCECQETPETFKAGSQICRTKVQNIVNSRPASDGKEWDGTAAILHARTAEALEVLLAYGADPNFQDERGRTAVHSAASDNFSSMERLKAICSVQRVKLKLPCSICPLESELENSSHNSDTLDRSFQPLAPRFDINIRDKEGRTALHEAARRDSAKVQLLLDAFPDIDIHLQDNESRSPLSYAVECANIETVQLLLSRCSEADLQHLNRPDKDGRTIVSYVADTEKALDILRLLLAKFPQIALDTPDNEGRTPLRWALEEIFYGPGERPEFIKALLATGQVNPFHAAHDGNSPFGRVKLILCYHLDGVPAEAGRDLLLEMIKTAENKDVMGKFQFGDEDLDRIEEEVAQVWTLIEECRFAIMEIMEAETYIEDGEQTQQSELDKPGPVSRWKFWK